MMESGYFQRLNRVRNPYGSKNLPFETVERTEPFKIIIYQNLTSLTDAINNFVVESQLSSITLIMELYSYRRVEDLKSKHETTTYSSDKGIDSLKLEKPANK